MNEKTENLVKQLLDVSPDERREVLMALFGQGDLPETHAPDGDQFFIGRVEVDKDLFDLFNNDFGIFDIKQLGGIGPQRAVDAFEAEKSAKSILSNARWYLSQLESRFSRQFIFHDEVPPVGSGIFGGLDDDLDLQLSLAEAALGASPAEFVTPVQLLVEQLIPLLEAAMGRPPADVAQELIQENGVDVIRAAQQQTNLEELLPHLQRSEKLSSAEGQAFVQQLWQALLDKTSTSAT